MPRAVSSSNPKKKRNSRKRSNLEKKQSEANIAGQDKICEEKRKEKKKLSEDEIIRNDNEEMDYLLGQKHHRPDERDPLRIFLETLYKHAPDCELAKKWMMEWGLLPPRKLKKIYETKLEEDQHVNPESPVKPASLEKQSEVSTKETRKGLSKSASKTKKRKSSESNLGDDFRRPKKKTKKHVSSI